MAVRVFTCSPLQDADQHIFLRCCRGGGLVLVARSTRYKHHHLLRCGLTASSIAVPLPGVEPRAAAKQTLSIPKSCCSKCDFINRHAASGTWRNLFSRFAGASQCLASMARSLVKRPRHQPSLLPEDIQTPSISHLLVQSSLVDVSKVVSQ